MGRSLPFLVRIEGPITVAGQSTRDMATIQSVSKPILLSFGVAAFIALLIGSTPLSAQEHEEGADAVWGEVFAGSELEQYLRLLQLTGESKRLPWSVRAFGPAELRHLSPQGSDHPWADRYDFTGDSTGLALSFVRPAASLGFNSSFPYGANDGAVWAGKGLTGAIQAGVAFRWGPLSGVFAPTLFVAGNADFDLMEVSRQGGVIYRDPRNPTTIDLPQRFGDGAYSRAEPGQSTLRFDYRGAALGFSTANQYWGPAREYPILLGANAAGFPHVFAGTSTPLSLWVGTLHGKVIWGSLAESEFSPMPDGEGDRLTTGLIATFSPRFPEGLEIGLGRFYHIQGSSSDIDSDFIARPFDAFLKRNLAETERMFANQLASIHARWVFPEAGFEIYGEFGREDHNFDLRDLIVQPDHDSAFTLGFQRVWRRDERYWALRGEVTEAEVSHLLNVRPQVPFYLHSRARQGHTHRGQLLGSPAVYGGSGAMVALDRYHEGGRLTAFAERVLRNEMRYSATSNGDRSQLDVFLSSGVEALFFRGPIEVTTGLTGTLNMNRDFAGDAFNLNARLMLRAAL